MPRSGCFQKLFYVADHIPCVHAQYFNKAYLHTEKKQHEYTYNLASIEVHYYKSRLIFVCRKHALVSDLVLSCFPFCF